MKKMISLLLVVVVLCGILDAEAFADDTTSDDMVLVEALTQGEEKVPDEGESDTVASLSGAMDSVVTPETTDEAQPESTPSVNLPTETPGVTPPSETPVINGATRLQIDDANVYDGMDKAYRDGYLPQVEEGVVTLVLPLVADGDIKGSRIVVTPNFGDSYSSPIQYSNYQKTFLLEEHLVNKEKNENTDLEEVVEAYLVSFELSLRSDRNNGTYPVSLSIQAQSFSGNTIQQTYTCYFTITDGQSAEDGIEIPVSSGVTMSVETPESQPRILISKYGLDVSPVSAGDEFTATVTLRNTSETMSVQNMVVTVSCDSANFVLLNDSNTIFIEKLEAGKTMDIEIRYRTDLETPPQRYNINLSMSYDNSDAMSLSSAGTIMVEVAQIPDVELAPFNLASELNAGETIQISFQVMNLGRSPIYNARVELSAPGLYPVGTGFIGNMEPGTAATTKLDVFVGMKEDEEERYGGTSGTVNLVYEDEDGQEYVQEVDINTNIQALVISSLTTDSEEEETATAGQWWISVSIGAVVIVTLVAIVRKQRPRRRKH